MPGYPGVMARRDEDALSWGGDDDPTLDTGAPAAADDPVTDPASLPDGWTPVGRGSGSVAHSRPPAPAAPPLPTPNTDDPAAMNTPAATDSPVATDAPEASMPEASVSTDAEPEPEGLGTVALVSIGVLGGVYLLFAIGWLVGGLRVQARNEDVNPLASVDFMYQGALWLATAAPLIWFATTLFATRKTRSWMRWLWLALGVLLLIPWPFLMIGAVGR